MPPKLLTNADLDACHGLTGEVDPLLKALGAYHVRELEAHAPTLEDFFFTLYRGDAPDTAATPAIEATS